MRKNTETDLKTQSDRITMLHGAGGSVMHELIRSHIVKRFASTLGEVPLQALADAAVVEDVVLKSDSHVVKPLFFQGGDIGRLAVSGTVNDISMLGARPVALSCALVLEEGLAVTDLERILDSMKATCAEADVSIVTGDTKVVERGMLGGCIINTSGIGKRTPALERNMGIIRRLRPGFSSRWILDSNLQPGDRILLSGTIGDHGIAVLSAQEGLRFGSGVESDVKPLNRLTQLLLEEAGGIVALKDPTRGGAADALNEFAEKSGCGILLEEDMIPVRPDVRTACEMLGLDPMEIGNEGKMLIGALEEKADDVLEALKARPEGRDAAIVGAATKEFRGVAIKTGIGGRRILSRPVGDPVPRIC